MATLQDLDRAYIAGRLREDTMAAREDTKHHARERIAYTLRDRVRSDNRAERAASDGAK